MIKRVIDRLQTLNILRLARELKELKSTMSQQWEDFKTEIFTETNRIGDDVKQVAQQLADAIDAGDAARIADLRPAVDALHAAGDQLHAMAGPDSGPSPEPGTGDTGTDTGTDQHGTGEQPAEQTS